MDIDSIEHKPRGKFFCGICSFLVILFFTLLIYIFVYLQMSFVNNPSLLFILLSSLLTFSFWSSAMEAALSTVKKNESNPLSRRTNSELIAELGKYNVARDKLSDPVSSKKGDFKELKRAHKVITNLIKVHRIGNGIDREELVGSYASLSVFLNLAIGVLIPIALYDHNVRTMSLDIALLHPWLPSPLSEYVPSESGIDLTSKTMFVFTLATLPVLIFGKILPKAIGLNYPFAWIERFVRLTLLVKQMFGWISIGVTWFIPKRQ